MKIPYEHSEILDVVCGIMAEVLGCEREDVKPDSTLGDDLDADSLGFVEINFSLEKRFRIVLPKKSIIDHAVEQHGHDKGLFIAADGSLTAAGVFMLEHSFFDFATGYLKPGVKQYAVLGMTTPHHWASSCLHILRQIPDTCPSCNHDTATVTPNHTMTCAHCGTVLKPRDGDEVLASIVPGLITQIQELTN